VRIGVTIFSTDLVGDVVEIAREAEARGFHSLFLPEHTHIPTSRLTPPPTGDDTLAEEYSRTLDPVVALAACASATSTLRLGTGVALPAQHHPIEYAKAWATLDHLSRGRAVMGVGFGWNREEMAQHGVEFATRREKVREHLLAMQSLWRDEEAAFSGEFVQIEPSWSWPKPVQQPRIPTLIGGSAGPKMFGHVAEWADGWIPIGGAGIRDAMARLGEAWAAAGRTGSPEIVPFGTLPDVGKLHYYRDIGCTEVVLRLPAADLDTVRRTLDAHLEVCRSADLL
jgi:probable F420-dependent oxidoreductase